MAGFLYYVPHRTAESLKVDGKLSLGSISQQLADALKDVLAPIDDAAVADVHMNGPDGGAGAIIAPIGRHTGGASAITCDRAKTDWYEAAGGKYWIGWVKGEVPGPLDLERRKTIHGNLVSDTFGREWRIPIARSPHGEFGALPKSFTFDGAGNPVSRVRDDVRWMWELAGMVNDQWAGDSPDFAWLTQQVPVILGINYRVGPQELNAMHQAGRGIVSEEFVGGVTVALIHGSIVKDAEQKKTEGA